MSKLTKEKALYEQLQTAIREMHSEIHAIYEPDGSEFFGDCYCAAVDLFSPAFTFRVYFKVVDGELDIQHVERWHFG